MKQLASALLLSLLPAPLGRAAKEPTQPPAPQVLELTARDGIKIKTSYFPAGLRTTFAVILLFALMAVSWAQQKPTGPILKVALMADGRITVNGAPATLKSLQESLKKLSQQKGVVWYYREAGNSEPPPEAKQAIQTVIDARLPIRLSSRPDYSDAIGMDGKPIKQ